MPYINNEIATRRLPQQYLDLLEAAAKSAPPPPPVRITIGTSEIVIQPPIQKPDNMPPDGTPGGIDSNGIDWSPGIQYTPGSGSSASSSLEPPAPSPSIQDYIQQYGLYIAAAVIGIVVIKKISK